MRSRRSITRIGGNKDRSEPRRIPPGRRNPAAHLERKDIELNETIHLHDLSPAERLLEESAERGFVEEKDIQALADEHELTEDDLTALRAALEERDVIVRESQEETRPVATAHVSGTLDLLDRAILNLSSFSGLVKGRSVP